jgi:nucleotide-binding universal stress UspA family protein
LFFFKKQPPNMNNTLLLATDFSPASQNAAIYALHLAKLLNARLELVHAYIIPFAYTDSPVPLLNLEEIQKISEDSINAEQARLKNIAPDIEINTKLLPGEIVDCLSDLIEENPPLLIVMGTSGNSEDSMLWGSMAVKSLRSLKAPVLAVPTNVTWKPVNKICFAADYSQVSEHTPAAEIISWTNKLGATLDVIHVDKPGQVLETPAQLTNMLGSTQPTYHTIIDENIETGVASFLQEHEIGWLLVIPKKYGFFENLFHKSRTKLLTHVSNAPVLALHQD